MGTRGVITIYPLAKGLKRGYVYMASDATEENVREVVAQVDSWIRDFPKYTPTPRDVAELIEASWNGSKRGVGWGPISGGWNRVSKSELPSESEIEVHLKIERRSEPGQTPMRWGLAIESIQKSTD